MDYTLAWFSGVILVQTKVNSFVVSILCEETANLGILDELLVSLREMLEPLLKDAPVQVI